MLLKRIMPTSIRRCLLVLPIALVAAAIFGSPGGATAQTSTDNGPIASTALQYLGTHGGQCWTFMRQVVQQATGRTIGFDYRQGFFDAGAVEVTADQAQNGDIIQIDNDADTSPSSYVDGQHTAIILQNLGGGVFNAIDSNQNWDEMVRLRPNYNPYAMAAAEGLQVHIYHIPGGGPSDAANSNLASAPAGTSGTSWTVGETGTVQADPGCLNLRAAAGLAQAVSTCLPTGTPVTVLAGPVALDGYNWIQVQTPSTSGWVAALYVAPSTTSPPAATTSSSQAATTVSTASSTAWGTDMHIINTPGCTNVHATPSLYGTNVGCLQPGSPIMVMSDPVVAANGYNWAHITNGYVSGYAATDFIVN